MKTYWQLDARERLALTEEEIKTIYVPREVAEAGLLMPRKPMMLPVPLRPEVEHPTSRTVFKVKGFKKADSGFNLNFLIVEKSAVIQYQKHVAPKTVTPEQNQDADAYKFGYRNVGIADTYENKAAGIAGEYAGA